MEIEKYIFMNNLRLCYKELFDPDKVGDSVNMRKAVGNLKEFADLCRIPENTMTRYIDGKTMPDARRIEELESILGKEAGYFSVLRPEVEFDKMKMLWNQPKQRGVRKKLRVPDNDGEMYAAENSMDKASRIARYRKEEMLEILLEIRKEVREHIGRENLQHCPKLREICYGY